MRLPWAIATVPPLSIMSWDKRATTRRPGAPEPKRAAGMYIVYLGIVGEAVSAGVTDAAALRVGDAFRLLPGAAITFGRSELCEVTIPSDQLSRAHALITFLPGSGTELALVDLRSRNGTWVREHQAPVHHVGPGGEFTLAKAFRFRCQPAG